MVPSDSKNDARAYLAGDRFMATMLHAEALAAAFDTGLVDCLISRGPASPAVLADRLGATPRGLTFLLEILVDSGVVEWRDDVCRLGPSFREVLPYRELMELKLTLINLAARDLLEGLADLVMRPERFARQARFARLFDYERAFGKSEADRQATALWMRVTTALTRHEAAVCLQHYDFSGYRRVLDVGGNSGEFARQLCRVNPDLRAMVFDLPLVCEAGRAHTAGAPEKDRLAFVAGDIRVEDLPTGHDLVIFKSMLHDWPEEEVGRFLHKAFLALDPGGQVLIFERAPVRYGHPPFTYAALPFLVFFHSYHSAETYAGLLAAAGFDEIRSRTIDLEMPFLLLTARRKNAAASDNRQVAKRIRK
ncbi:MAG: methyltransferase [Desulfosudaceae bacterium]